MKYHIMSQKYKSINTVVFGCKSLRYMYMRSDGAITETLPCRSK